jgi:hypothetical protein
MQFNELTWFSLKVSQFIKEGSCCWWKGEKNVTPDYHWYHEQINIKTKEHSCLTFPVFADNFFFIDDLRIIFMQFTQVCYGTDHCILSLFNVFLLNSYKYGGWKFYCLFRGYIACYGYPCHFCVKFIAP